MRTSALTLVRGRTRQLANLLRSLAAQDEPPDEMVIAWMQERPADGLPPVPFPVRHILVPGEPMPLAGARNRAAEAAGGEALVFLDVDCIATPPLVAAYRRALGAAGGLVLGEVRYLPPGVPAGETLDFTALERLARRHPARPPVPAEGLREERDPGQMWGLSFAIARETYLGIGGMDEGFAGYGGEETDFSARLAESGACVHWTGGALAYHQHHAVHVPPLPHFAAIVRNARRFRQKHGRWCMEYWLGQFTERGFIDWREDGEAIGVLREPTAKEIADSRRPDLLFS